jgi:hypothetical protein
MSANSQEIVQQIRDHFESLLELVGASASGKVANAYEIECNLLRSLMELGRKLLQLFFVCQTNQYQEASTLNPQGQCLPYHSQKTRSYWTVFGKIRIQRRYYYKQGHKGFFALDAALNLASGPCSDLLRQWRQRLAVIDPYHQVGQILADMLGQRLGFSTRALSEQIAKDGAQVTAFYQQAPAPPASPEATVLVVQADGKGVPLVKEDAKPTKIRLGKGEKNARKKEAIVSCVYTLVPWVRTPQEVVDSFFKIKPDPYKTERPAPPENKCWWATLDGKEAAITFTRQQARARDTDQIQHRIALTDGSAPLQKQITEQLPEYTLILDFVHANAYLWEAANAMLGEKSPKRTQWVQERTLQMLSGQTPLLIAELRQLAQAPACKARKRKVLEHVAAYFERNLPYMRYDVYLAAGWPIATGVIEGACRHLVKDRCELSGMRWTQPGAETLLHLRSVAENGDWEAFHAFRRNQRERVLYGQEPKPQETDLEKAACRASLRLVDCQAA